MASDNLQPQSLDDRAPMADAIELLTVSWANQRAFNSSLDFPLWQRRCLTTTNYLNNCFIGIEDGPANSALLRHGGHLRVPLGLAERSFFGCCFIGLLCGTLMARMMAGVMTADEECHGRWTRHKWKQQGVQE